MTGRSLMVIEPCGPPEDHCLQDNVAAIRAAGLEVDHESLLMSARDRLSSEEQARARPICRRPCFKTQAMCC